MTVSFSMQPCKTSLHEIDYLHTWTSFETIFPSPPLSLLGPCSFPTTGEKMFFKDACIKKYLYINRPMQSHVGREKVQKGINFC